MLKRINKLRTLYRVISPVMSIKTNTNFVKYSVK